MIPESPEEEKPRLRLKFGRAVITTAFLASTTMGCGASAEAIKKPEPAKTSVQKKTDSPPATDTGKEPTKKKDRTWDSRG